MRKIALIFISLLVFGETAMAWTEKTWSVGNAHVQERPVVYKFMNEFPDEVTRHRIPWLTVISWKYDGDSNNGMPFKEINESMINLEDGLEDIKGRGRLFFDVYSATGNNLKEFVYYISDREEFMSNFNDALESHDEYPIEINFYKDKEWSELEKLQSDFSDTANRVAGGI
jgi:hypothetical protein